MSLMETDSQNIDRSSPTFDAPDLVTNRLAHGTHSIAPRSADASTSAGKVSQRDDRMLVNDGSVDRIAIGRLDDGTYGIIVTQPGQDLSTVFS